MNNLSPDVQRTWAAFAAHAKACSACTPLADHQRRHSAEPPYILMAACCEPGKGLSEAWYKACLEVFVAFSNRFSATRA